MRHSLNIAAYGLAAALMLAPAVQAQTTKVPAEVKAGSYAIDPAHSKVTWTVSHFGFSTYVGQFAGVAGTLTLDPKALSATRLDVTVETAAVGTLNPALDKHLKSPDFLDTAAFPTATFTATSVTSTGERTADIAGNLTLHGVTRPVVIQAAFNQAGVSPVDRKYTVGFSGKTVVKRSDFGIKTYVPAISDDVTLRIDAEFKAAS